MIVRVPWVVRAAAPVLATALIIAVPAFTPATAQDDPDGPLAIKVKAVTLAPGGSGEAVVRITLATGYSMLSNPAPTQWTAGASLAVESAGGVVAKNAIFPEPAKSRDHDGGKEIVSWSGTFEVRVPLEVSAKAAPGQSVLRGRLRYQLRYEGDYHKVATRAIDIPITIAAAGKPSGTGKDPGAATRP